MQEDVGRHRELSDGSLFIATGPWSGVELIAPAMGQFSRLYPEIRIEVRVGDWRKLPGQWEQEEYDFMVIETSELDESLGFEITRLTRHPAFFFCRQSHPLLKKDSLSISDLASFPLIGPAIPERLKGLLNKLFSSGRTASAPPKTLQKYICTDLATIKAVLCESDSISVGTYGIAADELESGLFKALPFRIPTLTSNIHIVKRKGLSLSSAARAFIKVLIELDKELSHSEAKLIRSLGPEIRVLASQP
jgi:DNA-binding transcriptional LysR family regulator